MSPITLSVTFHPQATAVDDRSYNPAAFLLLPRLEIAHDVDRTVKGGGPWSASRPLSIRTTSLTDNMALSASREVGALQAAVRGHPPWLFALFWSALVWAMTPMDSCVPLLALTQVCHLHCGGGQMENSRQKKRRPGGARLETKWSKTTWLAGVRAPQAAEHTGKRSRRPPPPAVDNTERPTSNSAPTPAPSGSDALAATTSAAACTGTTGRAVTHSSAQADLLAAQYYRPGLLHEGIVSAGWV